MPRKERKRGFPRSHLSALRDSQRGERLARVKRKRRAPGPSFDPHDLLATMIDRVSAMNLESPEGDPVSVVAGKSTFEYRVASPIYSLTRSQAQARENLSELHLKGLRPSYWHDYTILLDEPIERAEFPRLLEVIRPVMSRYYRRRAYISVLAELPNFDGRRKSPAEKWRTITKRQVAGNENLRNAVSQAITTVEREPLKSVDTKNPDEGRGFTISAIAPRTWRP